MNACALKVSSAESTTDSEATHRALKVEQASARHSHLQGRAALAQQAALPAGGLQAAAGLQAVLPAAVWQQGFRTTVGWGLSRQLRCRLQGL
jgi:hypothetical protein